MSKTLKKVAGVAAPIAGYALGGPAGGVIGGALGGGLSGGGLKGVIGGGLGGAALGYGGALGGALSDAGGLGLGAAGANALGSGLLGAGSGGILGGAKGALGGGALGGLGGYYQGGGFDGALNDSGLGSLASSGGQSLENAPLTALGGSDGSAASGLANTGGTSLLAKGANALGIGNLGGAGGGAATSSYSPLTAIASGLIGNNTNDETQKALLEQQQKNIGLISPYLNESFDGSNLTNDPGYQFTLNQGTDALNKSNAAKGNYYSGAAQKELADYTTGLASKTYDDAYNRWLQGQQQKIGAAGTAIGIGDNVGNINANAATNQGNLLTSSLAGALGTQGVSNTGQALGALGSSNGIITIAGKQYLQNNGQLIPIG